MAGSRGDRAGEDIGPAIAKALAAQGVHDVAGARKVSAGLGALVESRQVELINTPCAVN